MLEEYTVVDLETSGLYPKQGDRVISISALKVKGDRVVDYFFSYLNPGIDLDDVVENITGITNAMLLKAPASNQVVHNFMKFIGNDYLITHHAEFEKSFLNNELELANIAHIPKLICTKTIAKDIYPYVLGASCQRMCDELKIDERDIVSDSHYEDVTMTFNLFKRIKHDLSNLGDLELYDFFKL